MFTYLASSFQIILVTINNYYIYQLILWGVYKQHIYYCEVIIKFIIFGLISDFIFRKESLVKDNL